MLLLLNLNVSIINSQLCKILKATVPPVYEEKHLYWIIALCLITMPAITNTHTHTHRATHTVESSEEKEEGKCEAHRIRSSFKLCVRYARVCCSCGKQCSLEQVVTIYICHFIREASIRDNHYSKTNDCTRNSLVCDNHISLCAQPQEVNSGLGAQTKRLSHWI